MMKRLLYFLPVMVIAIVIAVACSTEEEKEKFGEISGVVFDENVGEPLPIAQITLTPGGNSTVTGSDGSFSFIEILPGNYTITVNKKGYEQDSKNTVTVVSGKRAECNIKMKRIPAYVTADKEILDFGDNNTLNTLSFNIVNGSYENLSWHIYYDTISSFVTQVSPDKGITPYGKTAAIVVKINREKLNSGNNETTIQVISDNGDGSSEVKIKAIGQEKAEPSLYIKEPTDITYTTARIQGVITFNGIPPYDERGFVYIMNKPGFNPDMLDVNYNDDKIPVSKTEDSIFTYKLKGLNPGEYYVKAYAKNKKGTAYSNPIKFKTKATLPVVSIYEPNPDVNKKTATLHGSVDSIGDPEYYERGFVYCEGRYTPTVGDSVNVVKVSVPGTGIGKFDASISNLKLGIYSVRSYAINEGGYSYSKNTAELILAGTNPEVSVGKTTDINLTNKTAILHGNLITKGSPTANVKGFVYSSVNMIPTLEDYHVELKQESGHETGSYIMTISNLELGKTYYVRAYAKNEGGIAYSDTTSFNTNPVAPSISVQPEVNISLKEKTAVFKGTVNSIGNPAYSERGFVYSTTNNKPNINDQSVKVDGKGIGTYETTISDLILGKIYYVRAYAINDAGITYSENEVASFSTVPVGATVKMRSVTNVDRINLTALFQGAIETVGDPPYSEKGFVYSTTNNTPTTNDISVKVESGGTGTYETTITNLIFGKKYYVRAYAINETVTTYSDTVSFEISGTTPKVSVGEISDLSLSSLTATLNGYVSEVGYPAINERGFVYSSSNKTPSIYDSKAIAQGDAIGGSYSVQINNLVLDRTYYVNAYVSNSDGIYYSEDPISFSTTATLPSVTITSPPTNINTGEFTATISGRIEEAGNPGYTEKGFVYSINDTVPLVEKDNVVTVDGDQIGLFSTTLTNLVLGKKYYVRSYAKNAKGIAYSSTISFLFDQTLPEVQTGDATNVDINTPVAILHGSITDVGNPPYKERGFVLSTQYEQPTVDDIKKPVDGSGTGNFEYRLTEFSTTEKTYVRAYAINEKGVAYGESVSIFDPSFLDMGDYIILRDLGIAVQKEDIGYGNWYDMKRLCENSSVGGFSDWRLPTYNELCQLYNIREQIGNFQTSIYWSSGYYWVKDYYKTYDRTYYYGVNFSNGSKVTSYPYDTYYNSESATGDNYARAVRSLNLE